MGNNLRAKLLLRFRLNSLLMSFSFFFFFFPLFFLPELAVIPKYIYEYLCGLLGLRHDMKRSDLVSMALNYLWVVEDMRSELLGEVI